MKMRHAAPASVGRSRLELSIPFVLRLSKDELDCQTKILLQKSAISCGTPASIVARRAGVIHSVLFSWESAKHLAFQYQGFFLNALAHRDEAQAMSIPRQM